ncbi:ABC transporter ATP-binding protein/permease [Sesbania bispinosa]|nr:ABC transporter ATP-binding protein/permease [Sesbania bispinosa]
MNGFAAYAQAFYRCQSSMKVVNSVQSMCVTRSYWKVEEGVGEKKMGEKGMSYRG